MTTKPSTNEIIVHPLNIGVIPMKIVGLRPLIFHQWSEKAKQMILDKQMKKATKGREIRDPKAEYESSFYKNSKGEIAFPALAIKQAVVNAARNLEGVTMTLLRGSVFIQGDEDGLIKVDYEGKPEMREDMVRIGMGTADLRFRGSVKNWSMTFTVKHNADVVSVEQVINLFRVAGFACGLGEWRPERNGDFGQFDVATTTK